MNTISAVDVTYKVKSENCKDVNYLNSHFDSISFDLPFESSGMDMESSDMESLSDVEKCALVCYEQSDCVAAILYSNIETLCYVYNSTCSEFDGENSVQKYIFNINVGRFLAQEFKVLC